MTLSSPYPADDIDVTIESLGGLGDGIARFNDKPLFVSKSCPGDRLGVRIIHHNHEGYTGTITRILQPSPQRQTPPCLYFDLCGGCSLQQLLPDAYQSFKTRILRSALTQAGFPDLEASVTFLAAASRRRVEFKVSHQEGRLQLAFHAPRSHTPIPIDACTVLTKELEALIAPLNEMLGQLPFSNHLYAVGLTRADSGIDMMLTLKQYDLRQITPLTTLCENLGIARICLRAPETSPVVSAQRQPVEMELGGFHIPLPPDAFLQATSEGQALLTRQCLDATRQATSLVDLFCGIGSYSFPALSTARVHAVEGQENMVSAIGAAAKHNALTTLTCEQRDLFKKPLSTQELNRFDAAILNPPRLGAKAQTEQLARSAIGCVVMVSCNPATFARDAKILKNSGFSLVSAKGIDQFVWSPHLEMVAVFRRT